MRVRAFGFTVTIERDLDAPYHRLAARLRAPRPSRLAFAALVAVTWLVALGLFWAAEAWPGPAAPALTLAGPELVAVQLPARRGR